MFIGGGEPPPELVAQIEEQNAHQRAFRNDIKHMLSELRTHHLWVLRMLLSNIAHDTDTSCVSAANLAGRISAYLELRGACTDCGVDHDEEDLRNLFPTSSREIKLEQEPPPEIQATLKEYNVALALDGSGRVYCTGICKGNASWSSLDERMQFPPGGCVMCAHKTKWG